MFLEFVSQRIQNPLVLWSTIHVNKWSPFSTKFTESKGKSEIAELKEERSQIIQLMLSGHAGREIDENIFSHENSECPPSFTSAGHMYGGTKSEIMKCLIEFEVEFPTSAPTAYILILDGAYVMQSLRPGKSSTFKE